MLVNKAYRYELKPNRNQLVLLKKHAGCARFAWNWGLAERIRLWEQERKRINAIEQHRELNRLKKTDFPWMYEVSKCAPQEALRDLDRAFKNFYEGRANFPKFKKKGIHDSFRLTGTIKVFPKHVQLPRLGKIRVKEETVKFKGKILSATVSREADRWYVSLAVELETPDPLPVQGEPVGIDRGIAHFAILSTGEKVAAPKSLEKNLKKLCRLSRQLSRKQKGSKNRKKAALKLARLYRRIGNQRRDFLHKLSTWLAKTKPVIVIEDLAVKNMMRNKHLSRHIADAGWSEFRQMLEYKTKWYGSKLVVAPRFYPSSRMCSKCGHVLPELKLSTRNWVCPECGAVHDRDVNAAINLLQCLNSA
ncbi:MAG TPA: IS200/IS605 family element transposase accessory protein TnpB [Firmicutes bacterium]|nr:IS200/IS605 family element transposase accessory protein TnpB [Candidatus Fermentithermobacillaceae bacterium]